MLVSLLQPNGTPGLTDPNNQQLDRRSAVKEKYKFNCGLLSLN